MAVLRPFGFWVQNVLPQVYDDSLSYYELLIKVVVYLNNTIDEVNKISGELEAFENYIANYFSSADFQEIVNNKLDEMAEDGTLDRIIAGPKMLVPSAEDKAAYKRDTLACIASWLVNEIDSHSVANPGQVSGKTTEFYACYNDNGKSYLSLFESGYSNDFTYSDVHNGKPVVYMQCSGFLSMLTKCRRYGDSPYFYAFTNTPYDRSEALARCWEMGTYNNKPWTFDFLNEIMTWKMAYTMDKSGCTVVPLKMMGQEYDRNVLDNMETGDLIFFGNGTSYPNRYKGMNHCGYYIKSLSELDTAGEAYDAKFKAVDRSSHNSGVYGYMVHCSSGIGDEYTDVLRIDTMDYEFWANNAAENIYVCKPYSNALNSNKANRSNLGIFVSGTEMFLTTKDPSSNATPGNNFVYEGDTGATRIINPRIASIITTADDLSSLKDGFYTLTNWNSVANKPEGSTASSAIVWQFGSVNQYHGVQIAFDTNGFVFFRIRPLSDYWGNWHTLFENT